MLVDSHCHINDDSFEPADIVSHMAEDRLERLVCVGWDMQSSMRAVKLSEQFEPVYATVGCHPSDCSDLTEEDCDRLVELSRHPKVVAIGEIGLDYFYDDVPHGVQIDKLIMQLGAVERSGLPAVFHLRDAYGDMIDILRKRASSLRASGVMHCFSGSLETARIFVDMGLYISFSGSITFKNATKFAEIIKYVPLDRMLVETDCPYLTPTPFRGKQNYPKYVWLTAAKIADTLGIDVERVAEVTKANTYALFNKMK